MSELLHPTHCCAPARTVSSPPSEFSSSGFSRSTNLGIGEHQIEQVIIPSGRFIMGDSSGDGNPLDGETPVHEVFVSTFSIDATSVTNAAFSAFISDSGYQTEAEIFGFSAVFHLAIDAPPADIMGPAPETPWWFGVRGADWKHPGGSNTNLNGLENHPVVHISWNDAAAYCKWAGRRLPTEAEWERASRGGIEGARYPWGDNLLMADDDGIDQWQCNIWQGRFPIENTVEDGWLTTSPVTSFRPNGLGMWQTVGNVWEWCGDWYSPDYYRSSPTLDPSGPVRGTGRVLRGGSYLCHDSYCNRYRNSARSSNTPDSSMGNTGFRTVALT